VQYLALSFPVLSDRDSAGYDANGSAMRNGMTQVIRMRNMRGMCTHAMVIRADTVRMRLVAYLAKTRTRTKAQVIDQPAVSAGEIQAGLAESTQTSQDQVTPANGAPVSATTTTRSVISEFTVRVDGQVVLGGEEVVEDLQADADGQDMEGEAGDGKEVVKGVRWEVELPIGKMGIRVEVMFGKGGVGTSPGAGETSCIYLNRQY
jgi:hypothetical protein